jgi:hypothetical protein
MPKGRIKIKFINYNGASIIMTDEMLWHILTIDTEILNKLVHLETIGTNRFLNIYTKEWYNDEYCKK